MPASKQQAGISASAISLQLLLLARAGAKHQTRKRSRSVVHAGVKADHQAHTQLDYGTHGKPVTSSRRESCAREACAGADQRQQRRQWQSVHREHESAIEQAHTALVTTIHAAQATAVHVHRPVDLPTSFEGGRNYEACFQPRRRLGWIFAVFLTTRVDMWTAITGQHTFGRHHTLPSGG
jgi:hypothetical protein